MFVYSFNEDCKCHGTGRTQKNVFFVRHFFLLSRSQQSTVQVKVVKVATTKLNEPTLQEAPSTMTINYIGLVILIIGGLFLLMAIAQPKNFIVYKGLIARSEVCWGEGNGPKVMAAYSLMMIVFGLLLMFRVFGKQDEKED